MNKIGFIGAGTVGTAIGILLALAKRQVVAVYSISSGSVERFIKSVPGCRAYPTGQALADNCDFVFITTPDDFISKVASEISWRPGQTVVHCSGAASLDTLTIPQQQGAQVGSVHPLQTFAGVTQAVENLPGSLFALQAEEPLLSELKGLIADLQGTWLVLKGEDKALYHASAVIACNYFVTLVTVAAEMWERFGMSRDEAVKSLMPLLRGTLHNIETIGVLRSLTGPIARGDLSTIRKHLSTLKKSIPELLPLYREMGIQTISVALKKGTIDQARAEEMRKLLASSD